MSFGTEIPFLILLGIVLLGPRRLNTMLAQVARLKAQFENATSGFKSQLVAELDASVRQDNTDLSHKAVGELTSSSPSRDK
jgi:Sec-independent protein translocase protein TatA